MFSVYQRNYGTLTMAILAGKDSESEANYKCFLTLSTQCCVSYRHQSFDLQGKTGIKWVNISYLFSLLFEIEIEIEILF